MSGLPYECPGCYRNVRKGLLVLAVGVVVVVAVDVDVVDVLFVDRFFDSDQKRIQKYFTYRIELQI